MAAGEIKAAADRYNERKAAAVKNQGAGGQVVADEVVALVTSGLELDIDEMHAGQVASIEAAMRGIQAGVSLSDIIGGMWIDGLVTGVLLQEARYRRDERTDWETVARQLADWMVEEDDRDGATAEEFIARATR